MRRGCERWTTESSASRRGSENDPQSRTASGRVRGSCGGSRSYRRFCPDGPPDSVCSGWIGCPRGHSGAISDPDRILALVVGQSPEVPGAKTELSARSSEMILYDRFI